jgi:hypothetical protein
MQTSSKLPKPEVTRAKLVSTGIHKPTWTTHHYYETRPIEGTDEFEFVFACFKTGAKRRWGTFHSEFLSTLTAPTSSDLPEVPSSNPLEAPFVGILESDPSEDGK